MTSANKILTSIISRVLDPIVHLLLRYEVSHSEFSDLARRSYVKMAFKYFSIPGRKLTYSRVAVISGLSRQEVVRLVQLAEDEKSVTTPVTKGPLNRATRVIGGWLHDSNFIDEKGQPRVLPLRGEVNSFEELVARYSGGITARAISDELIRVGSVTKVDKNKIKLNHQGYVPSKNEAELVDMVVNHAGDMLGTLIHNVTHEPEERRFQRQVSYTDIPDSLDKEFKLMCYDKSLELALEMNRWLAEKKKNLPENSEEPTSRVGVGIYYFKNSSDEGTS